METIIIWVIIIYLVWKFVIPKSNKREAHPQKKRQASYLTSLNNHGKSEDSKVHNKIIKSYNNPFDIDKIIQPEIRFKTIDFNIPDIVAFWTYPLDFMPNTGSKLQIPSRGRFGRRGYKEAEFQNALKNKFSQDFEIKDDCILLTDDLRSHYEPDIALVHKTKNLYIDIEVDEPYVGIDNLERDVIHYRDVDDKRNEFFVENGWVVIRFAEIQVHQQLDACCRYVEYIIGLIIEDYSSNDRHGLESLNQWTESEAKSFSRSKYREEYLGIVNFNLSILSEHTSSEYQKREQNKEIVQSQSLHLDDSDPEDIIEYSSGVKEYTQTDNYDYFWTKGEKLIDLNPKHRSELRLLHFSTYTKLGYDLPEGKAVYVHGNVTKEDSVFYTYLITAKKSSKNIKKGDERHGLFTQ